jgi:hypothetical protein
MPVEAETKEDITVIQTAMSHHGVLIIRHGRLDRLVLFLKEILPVIMVSTAAPELQALCTFDSRICGGLNV